MKAITGKGGGYWVQRLTDYPTSELDDLQPSGSGDHLVSTREGAVIAVLEFNAEGKIALQRCGPSN